VLLTLPLGCGFLYGNKALTIGDGNAVSVEALKDVQDALTALKAAAEAGELDEAIQNTMKSRVTKGFENRRGTR